jgi:iron complex outermembrane receptor protein
MNFEKLISGIALILYLGSVHAQAPPATPAGTDALQEIIVTAQRRAEDVQHAALSIDVLSAQSLELKNATRASDIADAVPGLQITESGNSQQSLYIRSVGNFVPQSYTDPATSFNVDGVAIARPSSMTGVLYDLQRTEVLKGPQGTLYGRNATGGAVNVIPNPPQLGVNTGEVDLTVGNYGEVHPEVMANVALNDISAMRFAFTDSHHTGYQTDGSGSESAYAGRAQFLIKPNDDLTIRVSGDYAHDGGSGAGGVIIGIQNPFTGVVSPSLLPRNVGPQDPRSAAIVEGQYSFISGRFFTPLEGPAAVDNRFWGVLTDIEWQTPIGTLTILPAYRESSLKDLSTIFAFDSTVVEQDHQTSVEGRLASDNQGFFRWLVGAYYFHETIDATYQFDQLALGPLQQMNQGTLSKAEFARITIAPLDALRFSAGVRYTDDTKSFNGLSRTLISVCALPPTPIPSCPNAPFIPVGANYSTITSQLHLFPIVPGSLYGSSLPGAATSIFPLITKPVAGKGESTKLTYHAGVEYDLSANSLLYASWDTGYHAGGFAFSQLKPQYAPEILSAYAIGSKNRFMQDKLQFNAEAFYWRYTNQQISHGANDSDGTYVFYTDNAGSSIIAGAEFSVKYLLTPHTVLDMDVQYLSAVYNNFTYQIPAGGVNAAPLTGCPFSQTDPTHYTINCAGKTAQQSPRWAGSVGLRHSIDFGPVEVTGDIDAHGQSASVVGFELIPVEIQKSFAEGDASLGVSPLNGPWNVTAFVNNVTDRRPYGSAYYNSVNGLIATSIGPPRTFGVRMSWKF